MGKKVSVIVYGRMPTEKAYGIHAINQAKSFRKQGYQVKFYFPSTNNKKTIRESIKNYYDEDFEFEFNEVENFDFTGMKIFEFLPSFLKKFLWLYNSYFWSKKIQPLVSDSIIWSTNPVVCYALKDSYSVIFEKHGQGKWLQKFFINKLNRKNCYLIGTTKTSFEELKKVNSKSMYLPNGVDSDRFYPTQVEKTDLVVGYSGMLETYGFDKGVLNACKEMLKLMERYKFKVVIIGGPEYKINEIKKVVKKSKYVENFEFSNRLPQNELAERIRCFDIGLVPYPDNIHTNLYASPLKIFEYLASGVVPLISDLKAHRELYSQEMVFYKHDNFDNFAHVLSNLLDKKVVQSKRAKILELQSKLSLDFRTKMIKELLRL